MGQRWYDPATGRFISQDPIGFRGGLNLYSYVGGNPTNYIDPSGLQLRNPEGLDRPNMKDLVATPEQARIMGRLYAQEIASANLGEIGGRIVAWGFLRFVLKFSRAEVKIIQEGRCVVRSSTWAQIIEAHRQGIPIAGKVAGRLIQYEPGAPVAGMTMFGENGFILGNEVFATAGEGNRTVVHELYRLAMSQSAEGATAALATSETHAASDFATRAGRALGW